MQHQTKSAGTIYSYLLPFQQFLKGESLSGFLLILFALFAFLIANSSYAELYFNLKNTITGVELSSWSLKKPLYLWINDGLMAVFFFLVGLEIKRELLVGELSTPRDAALAVVAALGGMIVPAAIYSVFNWGTNGISGWGIPMATDIAFALGVMSLLGNRVPLALKIFLTALAIVDDIGAVIVIAVFYTADLDTNYLLASLGVLAAAFLFGALGGRRIGVFLIIGVIGWYFMLKSGVHATVAGVLLAFAIPMKRILDPSVAAVQIREVVESGTFEEVECKIERLDAILQHAQSPLHRLEHALHPLVAYFIMPVFAFFNAGVQLGEDFVITSGVTLGCLTGLAAGKPLGIFGLTWLSERLGLVKLPHGVSWPMIFATGLIAGIGFTMSFFIAGLAFSENTLLDQSKIGVLLASIVSAIAGLILLAWFTRKQRDIRPDKISSHLPPASS